MLTGALNKILNPHSRHADRRSELWTWASPTWVHSLVTLDRRSKQEPEPYLPGSTPSSCWQACSALPLVACLTLSGQNRVFPVHSDRNKRDWYVQYWCKISKALCRGYVKAENERTFVRHFTDSLLEPCRKQCPCVRINNCEGGGGVNFENNDGI
jgi:hypothetical protein